MKRARTVCLLAALGGLVCGFAVLAEEVEPEERAASVPDAGEPDAGTESFEELVARIEARRVELHARFESGNARTRARVRQDAREYVVDAMIEEIFPRWMGMPWTMAVIRDGLKPDARVPWEEGKGVSCSFFVTSTLENAGLRLAGRRVFAGAVALPVQRSLSPRKKDMRRWHGIGPEKLKQRMLKWGEGLYIVGLNCHIGYIVVREGDVRFVHSSYTEPFRVVDEPLVEAEAIALSPGYVVTALYRDDRLIDFWLTGRPVPFAKPKDIRR